VLCASLDVDHHDDHDDGLASAALASAGMAHWDSHGDPHGSQLWDVGQSFDVLLAASTRTLPSLDSTTTAIASAANGLPDLHSLPGAPTAIYLDFDGHGDLGAYDTDGDPATFNAAEAAAITEAHRQMGVYFAMFDVNVTTVKPTIPTAWIVISNDVTGGSSQVGVFPNTQPRSWIASSNATSRVSGIAHEIGHNFGLLHQSDYDLFGNLTSEYSNGTDDLHGALMGVDYRQDVNKWTLGHPNDSASALQDDIAVIASVIKRYQPAGGDGFRPDDFGGTVAAATPLAATAGARSVSGVIERMTDVDTFSFTVSSGSAVISVVPAKPSGLDAKVEVFDASGALVAARDGDANEQQIVLPVGSGTWYVSVASHGNYGDLGAYDLSVNDLPAGWESADIGSTGNLGDAGYGGGTFTVAGSGAAVGGTADSFRFAWQTLTGDGSIVARVTANQNTNGWAKAGVAMRESLAANSKHVAMVTTATQGPQLISRSTTGGTSATINGTAATFTETWVRLVRVGNVITASRSADGVTWTTVGSVTVAMGSTIHVGLLSSAQNNTKLNEARFTNVSLSGTLNAPETLNALSAPAGVTIRQGGGASFVVSWQPVTGAAGYAIERSENGVDFTSVFTAGSAATSWTNTGLAGAMRYFYRVRATTAAGRSTPSAIVSAVNRPSPVTEAAVTVLSNTHLVLNWIDTSGETGYRIERSTDNVTFTQIATLGTNVPSYSNSGLAAATQYWFRISPMTATGDGNPVVITASTTGMQPVSDLAFTSKASSAIGLGWTALGTATGYRIERSTNGTAFTTLATVPAGTVAYSDTSVAVLGKYYYRVVAINGAAEADPSPTIFTAAPAALALPKPWTAVDVGGVLGDGATGLQSGKFISVSSGTAIGGAADSFRYTYQPLVGDGSIVAKVSSLENTGGWAKGGVVIRESLDPNARQAVMVVSATNGIAWQYRQNVGGSGVVVPGPTSQAAPAWVKVTRAGNQFTGSWSADGTTWTQVGSSITISMGITVLAGLASTSDAAARLNRVEFTDVVASQIPTTDYVASVATAQTVVETGGLSGVGAVIKRGSGTLILSGANSHAGGLVVEQGEVVVRNLAALGSGPLEIRAGGRLTLDVGLDELVVPRLVLDPAGRIDIGAGRLTVESGLVESFVRQMMVDGRNGGGWDGSRGFVSRVATVESRTVGYVFDQGRATIAYAAPGDTNLDGVIDVIDITNLVINADSSGPVDVGWTTGDFNYDGSVDLLDISDILATGLFNQGGYLSSMDAAFASLGQEESRS
jgi:autotransporter-associated beta strand protein